MLFPGFRYVVFGVRDVVWFHLVIEFCFFYHERDSLQARSTFRQLVHDWSNYSPCCNVLRIPITSSNVLFSVTILAAEVSLYFFANGSKSIMILEIPCCTCAVYSGLPTIGIDCMQTGRTWNPHPTWNGRQLYHLCRLSLGSSNLIFCLHKCC